ncbi:hypothetical protein GGQ68_002580 [Sagittula marina]|uniref:Lipoprotein n=1 Tax=Sagittula marina TaxID=943940 RepID=A0A7W6DN75_9RHOB|nr:hypothetical protein [Sagittula marina]MBB3986241.1 hypothetical protein [Sagittula marina]
MNHLKVMTIAAAGVALMTLGACDGSSGSPGGLATAVGGGTTSGGGGTSSGGGTTSGGGGTSTGGGGGTTSGGTPTGTGSLAAFDAKALNYNLLVPTATGLTGTADYAGEISMLTQANAGNTAEAVVGDLNMTVNFDAGATNPVTATAGNFAGEVNGTATSIGGTLSTANAIAGDVNSVTATSTGAGTLTSATATLRGTLSDPTGSLSGDARMILSGNLKEAGGAKMGGGHQTTITPFGGGSTIATGGSLWADK